MDTRPQALPVKSFFLLILALPLLLLAGVHPLSAQHTESKPAPGITLKIAANYLAMHVSGSGPADATMWEYRLFLNDEESAEWSPFPQPLAADGRFKFDVLLPEWRWAKLEVRAALGGRALTAEARPVRHEFRMLTTERIAALPDAQRAAWQSYMLASQRHAERERDVLAAECRKLGLAASAAAPMTKREFETKSGVAAAWYGSPEALKLADAVLSSQTPTGGWSKAIDYTAGLRAPGIQWTNNAEDPWHYCGTLDNRSTTEQIKFLANVFNASTRDNARAGALRGFEWLLMAQFPNGGWPQNYPVEPGYHEAITLNDHAMLHAMELLLAASKGEVPFGFLDDTTRRRAATAFDQAIACLLDCQVKVDGKPAVWCAQHDPLSFVPVGARLKEPPSLSGSESADLLKFLMRKAPATPEVVSAIESGIAWLSAHRVTGLRKVTTTEGGTDYIADAASREVFWARFYDVQSGLPIFAGAEDGVIYSTFHDMAQHNQVGYDYFTNKPAEVIGKEMERWKNVSQKHP